MSNLTISLCFLCLIIGACSPKTAVSATSEANGIPLPTTAADSLTFPESWEGIWTGELLIYKASGLAQQLPMELHIIAIPDSVDQFTWTIIYGEDKEAGKRPYQLKVVDREKGIYAVDELNSIVLECYYLHNKLYSQYLVAGSRILVTNEVDGDRMLFEVIAGSDEPVSITGGETVDEEEIPAVSAYPITVAQRGVLTRKK